MKGSVTKSYARGVSEGLRRVITKGGVGVHFKPRNTLREHLVSPNDKFKKEERCHSPRCMNTHVRLVLPHIIGENKRPLRDRSSEHKREPPSLVAIHARTTGHNIPTDEARVLDQDESWFGRGVGEARYFKIQRSFLNRNHSSTGQTEIPGLSRNNFSLI